MRIFALEYATGGGVLERPALSHCRPEGAAMLRALAGDLADVPPHEVVIAVDDAATTAWPPRVRYQRVAAADRVAASWEAMMTAADAVWIVAPETGGILADLTRRAERLGKPVLGCPASAVEIAASKLATARHLARHGIAVVPTAPASVTPPASETGWVVKPDDGVGSEDTWLCARVEELHRAADRAAQAVIQPFIAGEPISISLLAQRGHAWILACNTQDVRREGGALAYRGGTVGGAEELRPALTSIAEAVAEALPQLWGYVGIDLVATVKGPVVLEINPRLTCSYVALRESIGLNPAELVLRLLDEPLPSLIRPLSPRPVKVAVAS
ncbi:MAG TPA: ATP-grasp domain-containing protein [Stellaceae bacterium]|nr:ATP-grasp domain-containing protein [Stellaceae bacterium]